MLYIRSMILERLIYERIILKIIWDRKAELILQQCVPGFYHWFPQVSSHLPHHQSDEKEVTQ